MLLVKKIVFGKGDYKYSIEYFDGKDVLVLSTNEEARKELQAAINSLNEQLKNWLLFDVSFMSVINTVKWGKNNAASVQFNAWVAEKSCNVLAKIPAESDSRVMTDEFINLRHAVNTLYEEVQKYLRGERAQQSLDFGEDDFTEIGEAD